MKDKRKKQEELMTELESIKDLLDSGFLGNETFANPRSQRADSNQDLLTQNSGSSIEIPVLNEMVIVDVPSYKESSQDNLANPHTPPNNALLGQQLLLDKEKIKKEREAAYKTELNVTNSGTSQTNTSKQVRAEEHKITDDNVNENPFLPKHIRERLTKPADLEAILAGTSNKRLLLPPIVNTTIEDDSVYQSRFFSKNSFLDSVNNDPSKSQSLEAVLNKASSYKSSLASTFKSELASQPDEKIDPIIDELVAQYLPELEAKLRFQLKQSLVKKPQKK